MQKDAFDDLKQFMTALVSRTEVRLSGKIGALESRFDVLDLKVDKLETKVENLGAKVDKLEKKMDDGFAVVGEVIDNLSELIENRHKNHEKRITKLEHAAAH